jgi:hypothetical protein
MRTNNFVLISLLYATPAQIMAAIGKMDMKAWFWDAPVVSWPYLVSVVAWEQ